MSLTPQMVIAKIALIAITESVGYAVEGVVQHGDTIVECERSDADQASRTAAVEAAAAKIRRAADRTESRADTAVLELATFQQRLELHDALAEDADNIDDAATVCGLAEVDCAAIDSFTTKYLNNRRKS